VIHPLVCYIFVPKHLVWQVFPGSQSELLSFSDSPADTTNFDDKSIWSNNFACKTHLVIWWDCGAQHLFDEVGWLSLWSDEVVWIIIWSNVRCVTDSSDLKKFHWLTFWYDIAMGLIHLTLILTIWSDEVLYTNSPHELIRFHGSPTNLMRDSLSGLISWVTHRLFSRGFQITSSLTSFCYPSSDLMRLRC
jgi:hypothetical protein